MLSRLLMLLAVLVAAMLQATGANAERRVALVIGNSAYANAATLRNPSNDATDMAAELKQLGFEVVLGLDLTQQKFASTIQRFAQILDDADVALFFYAGHGLQINDKNYLVSVDARLNNEFLVSSETIELDAIVRLMESRVPINLVFLDACRNNPLAENLRKNLAAMKRGAALGRGLARIEPTGRDTLIAFAAAPGQEAADGYDRNSPFTKALLKYMAKPGLEVSVMLKAVAADVRAATRNAQRPQQLSDMTRTFYFARAEGPAVVAAREPPPRPAPAMPPAPRAAVPTEDHNLEVAFWNAAQAANECGAMQAYLQRFPNGIFVALAKLAERRLCAPQRHVTVVESGGAAAPSASAPAPQVSQPAPRVEPPRVGPQRAQPVLPVARPAITPPGPLPTPPLQIVRPQPAPPSATANKPAALAAAPPAPRIEPPAASPQPPQQQALVAPRMPPPAAVAPGRDCATCPEMVEVPGGSFQMGSNEDATEKPVHTVSVAAFSLSKYPVTIGEWKQCVAAKACSYVPKGDDDLPVYNVSWNDAQRYVRWLSQRTGKPYRLPTEAEWEYAVRARTTSKYWWGNQLVPGKAACKGCGGNYQVDRPMKVGSFAANPFGLFDMTGSVAQWVADCWHRDYHGAPHNGAAWEAAVCTHHVLRGGSWKNDASYLRSSNRASYDTDVRYETHGFRVARSKGQ